MAERGVGGAGWRQLTPPRARLKSPSRLLREGGHGRCPEAQSSHDVAVGHTPVPKPSAPWLMPPLPGGRGGAGRGVSHSEPSSSEDADCPSEEERRWYFKMDIGEAGQQEETGEAGTAPSMCPQSASRFAGSRIGGLHLTFTLPADPKKSGARVRRAEKRRDALIEKKESYTSKRVRVSGRAGSG